MCSAARKTQLIVAFNLSYVSRNLEDEGSELVQWCDITEGLGSFHLPSASSLVCRLLPLCLLPHDHKIAATPPGITSIFQAGRKADAAFLDFPSNVAFLGTLTHCPVLC